MSGTDAPGGQATMEVGHVDGGAQLPVQETSPEESSSPEADVEDARRRLTSCPEGHPDRSRLIHDLAAALRIHFGQCGSLDLLAEAVDLYRQALNLLPLGHPDRLSALNNLSSILWRRFEQHGDLSSLVEVVDLDRQALILQPLGHPNRFKMLNRLADSLMAQFCQTDNIDVLPEVVDLLRQAIDLLTLDHPDRWNAIDNLAVLLTTQSDHLAGLDSLAEAVNLHRQALILSSRHPDRVMSLFNLSGSLMAQFRQTSNMDLLPEMVDLLCQALDQIPLDHPDRWSVLNNLAVLLKTRFEKLGHTDSLAEAIGLHRQALSSQPRGHAKRLMLLSNLVTALEAQASHSSSSQIYDLCREVCDLYGQTLDLLPLDHPDRWGLLAKLSVGLLLLGQPCDIDYIVEALDKSQQRLDLLSMGDPSRLKVVDLVDKLAESLAAGLSQIDDLDLLAKADRLYQQALDLLPLEHPSRSRRLQALAISLATRFEHLGGLDLLASAVDLHRQVLDLQPLGHPCRSNSLCHLASTLLAQFRQIGDSALLAEAVNLHRQALSLHSPGNPDRWMFFNNLASSLATRFHQLGDLNSLAESVDLYRQTLNLLPPEHPQNHFYLTNLGNTLEAQFEQLSDPSFLTESVNMHRQALRLCPPGDLHRWRALSGLAASLHTQFKHLGGIDSLAEAAALNRQALDSQPLGHPHRSVSLLKLLVVIRDLSVALDQAPDLEEELALANDGLQCCEDGHPMRARFLFGIVQCVLSPDPHFFDPVKGIRCAEEGLRYRFAAARERLAYGMMVLSNLEDLLQWASMRDPEDARAFQSKIGNTWLPIYVLVIQLLPVVASFGLNHTARLRVLSKAEGVSRDAAARAISVGRVAEAVEMLEEGRGVFWFQALKSRATDLDLLSSEDAEELRGLFQQLEAPSASEDSMDSAQREHQVEGKRILSEAAEACIADIRTRPGMQRFLLPLAFTSLIQGLPVGFVVMLNMSKLGHYALVLDGGAKSVHSLALRLPVRVVGKERPKKQQKVSREFRHQDDTIYELAPEDQSQEEEQARAKIREEATFKDSLADLWVFIVKPVIDLLELKKKSGRDRPRVWWCATGSLTFLPIHAAGGYSKAARERSGASTECASDYIVSSYIPSILTLLRARNTPTTMARSQVKGLLVQEGSPGRGWQTISKVKEEARLVKESFEVAGAPVTMVNETSVHPTVPEVLACLQDPTIRILHLACHGAQKPDPLASAFIFRDGDLSIQELMKLELKHASMAFLSACQTAKGDENQPDQAVHLAASLLFCGFKSVVATMWSMTDADGPIVASSLYKTLFQEEVFDLDVVPYALDNAARRLREEEVDARRWAVFVHMGA